jgi:hypothetical protein
MLTLDILIIQMNKAYSRLHSWRKVGILFGIDSAVAIRIVNGWQPGPKTREKLGLPPIGTVVVITGEHLPHGTQSIGPRICVKCGRPFIENTATRTHCFICSPYRG